MNKMRELMREPFLVTGAAGFVGFHLCRRLLADGAARVVGVDNLRDDDNSALKHERLSLLRGDKAFRFAKVDITDGGAVQNIFAAGRPAVVLHFAAIAGVRASNAAPAQYANANITGFANVLQACRHYAPQHLLHASSSSVYGELSGARESATLPAPLSVYAATKITGEHLANVCARNFGVAATALRLFTVYGPRGRRDMAVLKFAEQIAERATVTLVNNGANRRSFTYIDDVVEAVVRLVPLPPDGARAVNIGGAESNSVCEMLALLEKNIGQKAARVEYADADAADAQNTFADCRKLRALTGFAPSVSLQEGLAKFSQWHQQWRNVK